MNADLAQIQYIIGLLFFVIADQLSCRNIFS